MTQEAVTEGETKRGPTFAELLRVHVLETIDPYASTLEETADEEEKLGKPAREKLEVHRAELEKLKALLGRLIAGEPFQPVVSQKKNLPNALGDLSKETYTFRLAPKDERMVPGTSQDQLGFHLAIDALSERALTTMNKIALSRNSAHDVLQQYFNESLGQRITVNTVNVSRRIDSGEFLINPQAGISFQWIKGENRARVGGVTWVGYKPHFLVLPERELKLGPFLQIQKTIVRLTDEHIRKSSSPTRY